MLVSYKVLTPQLIGLAHLVLLLVLLPPAAMSVQHITAAQQLTPQYDPHDMCLYMSVKIQEIMKYL